MSQIEGVRTRIDAVRLFPTIISMRQADVTEAEGSNLRFEFRSAITRHTGSCFTEKAIRFARQTKIAPTHGNFQHNERAIIAVRWRWMSHDVSLSLFRIV